MTQSSFLDVLADQPPADRVLMLARALGETVRASTDGPDDRRTAVDALLQVIERSAGLRL